MEFGINDFAPVGCEDCKGCYSCCTEMGDSIIQDPFDYWIFSRNMKLQGGGRITFDMLVSEDGPWELSIHDGLLLPNIKMVEDGRCPFLSDKGRCTIHMIRSGLCRLFPLARVFDDDSLSYILLDEDLGCEKIGPEGRRGESIRISKWLGYAEPDKYEKYQILWHSIKKKASAYIESVNTEEACDFNVKFLNLFYADEYGDDFFGEFDNRCNLARGRYFCHGDGSDG